MYLWAKKKLFDDPKTANWVNTNCKNYYLCFPVVDSLDATDHRCLVFIELKSHALWTFSMNVQLILMKNWNVFGIAKLCDCLRVLPSFGQITNALPLHIFIAETWFLWQHAFVVFDNSKTQNRYSKTHAQGWKKSGVTLGLQSVC